MQIKLWGVRGSIAAPVSSSEYKSKIHSIIKRVIESKFNDVNNINDFIKGLPDELRFMYGGNTTCATVTSNSGKMYIIDCGTGLRPLGDKLMEGDCCSGKGIINIFMTHNHWDHIQGLPFFKPLYIKGNVLNFYSPYKNQEEALTNQMTAPYFPATFTGTPSIKKFHLLDAKNRTSVQLEDDLVLDFFPLKHPGGSFAYKFKQAGKSFIFATDAEFTGESLENTGHEVEFFRNTDLLVLDSQYTLDESFMKIDWGHTSVTMAVNCGLRWNVRHLVLTHHEPSYRDEVLLENLKTARAHQQMSNNSTMSISLAREDMVFQL